MDLLSAGGEQDPYAIASAPDNGSLLTSAVASGQNTRLPCSNCPTKLFGVFR